MPRTSFLPYALPTIGEEEIAEVVDSLRSGWVTTGPKVKRFESDFCAYTGAKHAIAVNSCTAGLHIALTALGVGPGDEVVLPTLTFCSTASVVVHLGATPVLVDIGEDYNVRVEAIEAALSPRTRVIVVVHYGGQACDLEAVYDLARRKGLPVVEDAAHAVGSTYQGIKVGADALAYHGVRRAVVFSFYATKNMTTGEGGMITTSDDELADSMRLWSLHGMSKDAWKRYTSAGSWFYEVVLPGYKDNMTDIQAALGLHQLRKLDGFIAARQALARLYDRLLANLIEIKTPLLHINRNHIYHIYAIRLQYKGLKIDRGQFIEELKNRQVGTSVHFIPVHLHPYYQERFGYRPGSLPAAEDIYAGLVSLPLYPRMTEQDLQDVVTAVEETIITNRR